MTADEQIRRGSRHARPVEDLTTKARSKAGAGQVSNPYPVLSVFPPPRGTKSKRKFLFNYMSDIREREKSKTGRKRSRFPSPKSVHSTTQVAAANSK